VTHSAGKGVVAERVRFVAVCYSAEACDAGASPADDVTVVVGAIVVGVVDVAVVVAVVVSHI
jgi:hypothetical protein